MIRLPAQACPKCGHKLDAVTKLDDDFARPSPGDVSICLNCQQILMFDKDLKLETAKWQDLPVENQVEVKRILGAMDAVKPIWKAWVN